MQKIKPLLTIIFICTFFFSLFDDADASNAMNLESTMIQENNADTSRSNPIQETVIVSPELAFHIEFGGQYLKYHNPDEPYQFNPAAALVSSSSSGWEHIWREKRSWLRAGYDVLNSEHLLLQPGLMLGAVRSQFKASNATLHFSEEWQTRPALLWGLSLAGELRADRQRGPFLKVQYLISRAQASEKNETVISDNGKTTGAMRDARFCWQEAEVFLGVGYRWGTLKPMAGTSYTDFRLQKWIRYHISESGLSNTELQIVQALNSAESEYHFRNSNSWTPFLAVEWMLAPAWTVVAVYKFPTNEDFSLALRMSL